MNIAKSQTRLMDDFILFIILSIAGAFSRLLYNQLRKTINKEHPPSKKTETKTASQKEERYDKTLKPYS
ncbi:hypothetical protein [Owenweeksia hongkongensis]|uniref:Uncharacterized protein n=1 Tax=Owenweeksia hongkongensis (strain DSM 17368 / CIP 108786 / JCM 12287 / NRRL B-23963 / UST20020801) TaxID=926562 RepID=G8R4R8_OWEHD|nr:hypothetical protein [Owenweeksia hongkongensis]AEV33192.1 hypothetical protein Oweho_2218 [Owenweeksia hongkongensis DSM 17368]